MGKPNSSIYLAEAMTGEAPGHHGQWTQLDSLDFESGGVGKVCKTADNNVSIQTGEEFSMKFLQECAAAGIVASVHGINPNYEKKVGVSDVKDGQMVYEELARILCLRRIDSECGSDITEFASARGSMSQIDNGVYTSNESMHYKEIGANGTKANILTVDAYNDQTAAALNVPVLNESDSSRSLYSSALGGSNGSLSGKIKVLCSFGGKILPRPSDGKLRYVGGETRIISIQKNVSWEELVKKTSGMCNLSHSIKYQLPGEDLDALISVSSDEDLQNMIDEYDGVEYPEGSQRLRIFLIPLSESETSNACDAGLVQQNNTDYQYVAAVNGIVETALCSTVGTDPILLNHQHEQPSGDEMFHAMPNEENSSRYEKIFPFPVHPVEIKDSPGALDLAAILNDTEKLISSRPITSVSIQQEDVNNGKTTMYKDNSSFGGTDGLMVLSSALPLQPEGSISYAASHDPTTHVAVNLMNSHDPVTKQDTVQLQEMNPLILNRENFPSQAMKQGNDNVGISHPEWVANMEGTFGLEVSLPQNGNLVDILPTSGDSVGCYQGIPHASSDPNLHGQRQMSPFPSHEGVSQSFSLKLEKPPSSWCRLSTDLLEKPVEPHENVGFVNTQLPTKVSNGDPLVPATEVSFLNPSSGFPTSSQLEVTDLIGYTAGKEQLSETDFRSQISMVQSHKNGCDLNVAAGNRPVANDHLLSSSNLFGASDSSAVANELAMGLKTNNYEAFPPMSLNSPKQDAQVSRNVIPASVNANPLNDLELEQAQKIHAERTSTVVGKGVLESCSSFSHNFEVADHTHGCQEESYDNSSYPNLLDGLSNCVVSPVAEICQSFEGSRDVSHNKLRFGEHNDLDQSGVVDDARGSENQHNSATLSKREVSLLDVDLPNFPEKRAKNPEFAGTFNEQMKSRDGQLVTHVMPCEQKPGSGTEFSSIIPFSDVPAADNAQILPSPADEAQNTSQDLEDVNADSHEEELFSDAMIAEMEADLYGLQIIKNADLEELRELGSGTYGTVYYGKWRGTDVAIKRIKKACFSGRSSEQERLTKDFWREARILSNLHHPNVVAFYGVVPDGVGGTLATVTEFMANGSLRNALLKKDKILDQRKKLIIAMDAAFGMEYLHSKNIVHFDLKCDNLLVNLRDPHRPICKVGDFGLSKIKRNTLVSGGVRGTLPWMAPELLNGSSTKVSEKVDVFSFGIVLWEILTGEEPYANMHCGAIIGGIVKNTLRPQIPEQCDPEWRSLMEQCWLADPDGRPSFTEITYRLRSIHTAIEAKGQSNSVRHRTNK
ncbi:uncharacterized protein LOC127259588 [Andrographis paniculata]|uniref:uncharacterized protein LOC127259588 n=1 Tax=Andrographis paniculata TaxID=175694 RepID=UPI0021E7E99C|nr:uncharacterized protein LOC127259588 [Andrographis paniculata]XP_051142954.1 uncharacterized protein LOC127259588 [Andrographis paniculata]XP_051142955.1 uncharacterized protein LOC127259588 [Andrographis paniculata]